MLILFTASSAVVQAWPRGFGGERRGVGGARWGAQVCLPHQHLGKGWKRWRRWFGGSRDERKRGDEWTNEWEDWMYKEREKEMYFCDETGERNEWVNGVKERCSRIRKCTSVLKSKALRMKKRDENWKVM